MDIVDVIIDDVLNMTEEELMDIKIGEAEGKCKRLGLSHRTLFKGELLRGSDECLSDLDGKYYKLQDKHPHMIGRAASDPKYQSHSVYRRKVK